ncbi:uncharacterized protein LOC134832483 isoform X2 [Culicoides brevitarsis]|uniref:uncharacterized protein LOC134832483 isoform X2 n=1 Tax=Culicoides brevitarsis TaxID=469753 RepID=UPI00307CA292
MTDLCTNCRSRLSRDTDLSKNYTDARLESDMQSMMLRMDQMQEMMTKLMTFLPNLLPAASEMPLFEPPMTPAPSQKSSSSSSELDDAETYIAEDLRLASSPVKTPLKRLPSVILEQPIDSETISFISASCENSQDTGCSDDMFHESFLEVAMKQIVGDAESELDILSSIDNVYQIESLDQTFPIMHQEELDAMEEQMLKNDAYRETLMKELKLVRISMGVNCDFADILEKLVDRELLHFYNWYGNQGKKSLQRYKIFHQLLREVTIPPNGKSFDDVMHRALTVSHRRKNNQVYRKKRKIDAIFHRFL